MLWKMYIFVIFGVTTANPDAKRLYDDLMSSYNRLIRPVVNNSDTLTVRLGLKLSQLIDVVSKKEKKIICKFCIRLTEYGNVITYLHIAVNMFLN